MKWNSQPGQGGPRSGLSRSSLVLDHLCFDCVNSCDCPFISYPHQLDYIYIHVYISYKPHIILFFDVMNSRDTCGLDTVLWRIVEFRKATSAEWLHLSG